MSRFAMSLTLACSLLGAAFATAADDLEPGFKPLVNGKDLSGWKTKKGDSLDGQAVSPDKRFKVEEGRLIIDTSAKGDVTINTAEEFAGDLVVKFEYKPGKGCNNDLFLRGTKFDLKPNDVKNLKQDEWNEFEIIVTGDKAEFKNNGELQKTLPAKSAKSPLGLRAEFGPIEYRKLRIKSGS